MGYGSGKGLIPHQQGDNNGRTGIGVYRYDVDSNGDYICVVTNLVEVSRGKEAWIMMNLFWNGRNWESVETYFTILQRALWVELSEYGGELWG